VWIRHHEGHAPGLIEGLYLAGSVALDDWRPGSNVDIVAMTADPATDDDVELLRRAAEATRRELAGVTTIDGPIVAWSDLASPPLAVMRPWTLGGEFRFDGECSEINPVTWFILAQYGVAAIGGSADRLGVFVDGHDRVRWVVDNVDTYWRGVCDQLVHALGAAPDQQTFDAEVIEWCALGIARMAFTSTSGDVASKTAAGEWAMVEVPEHRDLFELAVAIRARHILAEQVDRSTFEATVVMLSDLADAITG
jgi:hypothetical protein